MDTKWFILLLFNSLYVYQEASSFNLDSIVDIMDSTRSELLSMDKTYYKPITVFKKVTSTKIIPYVGVNKRINKSGTSKSKMPIKVTTLKRRVGTEKKQGAPLNKYHFAINQVEKGIMESATMRRYTDNAKIIVALKNQLKFSVDKREFTFARNVLGHIIHQSTVGRTGRQRKRVRRQGASSSQTPIASIANWLGKEKFANLMALDGGVTLAFAMDTTYSMYDEIQGAKKLAQEIINMDRKYEVDYVLSPFNDPRTAKGHGPVTYYDPGEKHKVIEHIGKLSIQGGGDCPELIMEGIQKIFTASVAFSSPIYVFTDAGPKDLNENTYDHLLETANAIGAPISFFLSHSGCMKPDVIESYSQIANETGGEILFFGSTSALTNMASYVNTSLFGGSYLPVRSQNSVNVQRKRRQVTSGGKFTFLVDDTINTLSTSITTNGASSGVKLVNPNGGIQVSGKTDIGNGVIFSVDKPSTGIWNVIVDATSSVNSVTVKGVSSNNVDFDYHFTVKVPVGRRRDTDILTKYPLIGKKLPIIVTVTSPESVMLSSLKVYVTDRSLMKKDATLLKRHGSAKLGRFKGEIFSPGKEFFLVLEGLTKGGKPFQRLSRTPVHPTTLLARIYMARKGFTLEAGNKRGTSILVTLHSFGISERCQLKLTDLEGYSKRLLSRFAVVRNGRMAFIPLKFVAPRNAKKGSVYKAVLTAKGLKSKNKARLLISLLIS